MRSGPGKRETTMKRRALLLSAAAVGGILISGTLRTALAAPGAAVAQGETENEGVHPTGQPWPVRDTEAFHFDSTHVGDRFAIGVWQPDPNFLSLSGGDQSEPMDVVYVLDGSWALGIDVDVIFPFDDCGQRRVHAPSPPVSVSPDSTASVTSRSVPSELPRLTAAQPATAKGAGRRTARSRCALRPTRAGGG